MALQLFMLMMKRKDILSKRVVKRFYRSVDDQIIFGVCAGVAEYFEIDPSIVRLAFALMCCFCFPLVIVYFVAGIVVPLRPVYKEAKIVEEKEKK